MLIGVAVSALVLGAAAASVVWGGPPAAAATTLSPGTVFIADTFNNRVVEVPPGGGAQTTVGTGLNGATVVAVDDRGDVFIADTSPATATVGIPFSFTYTAAALAGEPAATFAVSSGMLPPGLTLNATTGVLSGMPTAAGTYQFVAEAENAANNTLGPSTTITVTKAAQTITFTPTPPTDAAVGGPPYTVTATGGASGNPVVFTSASTRSAPATVRTAARQPRRPSATTT